MQGEQIDIEALFRKHELSQAVGNMNSNARGDELGPKGAIVKTREQKAREYYQKKKAMKSIEDQQKEHDLALSNTKSQVDQPKEKDLTDPTGAEGMEKL